MELKDFIKEAVSSIADAVIDLQTTYEARNVLINPPVADGAEATFRAGDSSYILRRVQDVDFDVAVTVASGTSGGAGGGIKIFAAEVGAKGEHSGTSENVSRVRFSLAISLPGTQAESQNVLLSEAEKRESDAAISRHRSRGGTTWTSR